MDNTNTTAGEPTLAASVAALAASIEKAKAVPTGTVTQTPEQGAQAAVVAAREHIEKSNADAAQREAVNKHLAEQLARAEADLAALKAAQAPVRKSEFSLGEARAVIADGLELKSETRDLFGRFGASHATQRKSWQERFESGGVRRTPLDVVMRGAILPNRAGDNFTAFTVGSDDDCVRRAQDLNDAIFVWRITRAATSGGVPVDVTQCPLWDEFKVAMGILGKALDTSDTSGYVPTGFSSALIERYELARNMVKYIKAIPIPRSPFQLPVVGARTTTYKIAEQTADPESATAVTTSDLADATVTFTLTGMGARTSWSYELDEDSIVTIATLARNELGKSWAFSEEQALLDGDTTGTHQDSDVTAATDVRKTFKGYRKHCIANSYSTSISAFTIESFTGMIKSMGKYGVRHSDLVWFVSPSVRAQLLTLKDANNYPVMYGQGAIGSSGVAANSSDVPSISGIPVVTCEAFREDLNAAGIYDGTTTTKTGVILANREGFGYAYTTQAPILDSQKWIRTRQIEVVFSTRRDFQPLYAIASNKVAWYGYNVTS